MYIVQYQVIFHIPIKNIYICQFVLNKIISKYIHWSCFSLSLFVWSKILILFCKLESRLVFVLILFYIPFCVYYIYKNLSICNARKTNVQKEVGHIIFHSLLEDNATRKLLGIDKNS